jgi:hypothetical protein
MLQPNQPVYYTSSLLVQEATFLRYDGDFCILSTPFGDLKIRRSRIFTVEEAAEKGLLDRVVVAGCFTIALPATTSTRQPPRATKPSARTVVWLRHVQRRKKSMLNTRQIEKQLLHCNCSVHPQINIKFQKVNWAVMSNNKP